MKHLLPVIICSFFLLSCGPARKAIKTNVVLDTVSVIASNSDYRASATKTWEITHTRVDLSFNWKERTADASAWVRLHPYCYTTDTLALDAKSMHIDSVLLYNRGNLTPVPYTYAENKLNVKFHRAYNAADTIELYIKYRAMPYSMVTGGSAAITDDRGLYFINTDYAIPNKPAQIWTQGETESNSHWMPTIDKPNQKFTTEIHLTVPDSFTTLSNGYLAKHVIAKGMRTDTWKMDKPIQAYAVMFAIGKFSVIKDKWRDRDVDYYVEPAYAPYARKMFNNTPDMMEYFSNITGVPYPWNKYAQVVVRDYVSGAMENTSASLFGEFLNQNSREIGDINFEDVVSHELFHQWFGDYVTCESWSNVTVNESFANYSEQLWRRHMYGEAYAQKLAYEDLQKYLNFSRTSDAPLVRYYYNDKEEVFDPISYEKGGAILHCMQTLMGDEAFYKAMNLYLTRNALHSGEAAQWRLAVEEATGKDWNLFFNQWYYHSGHPVLNVKYAYDDDAQLLTVHVDQVQQDSIYTFHLPLKAAVISATGNTTIVDWDISHHKTTFVYPYKNGERPVIVPDYTHILVGDLKENKKPKQWLIQFNSVNDYTAKRLAIDGAMKKTDDSSAQLLLDNALNCTIPSIKEYALTSLNTVSSEKLHERWKGQVQYLAINDGNKKVRAYAYQLLGKWKIMPDENNLKDALYDSSYLIAGNTLYALYSIDSLKGYNYAKQLSGTNPQASLQSSIWYIIGGTARTEDIEIFTNAAPYVYGTRKFQFTTGLYYYLQKVKDDAAFEKGVRIIAGFAMSDGIKSYRLGFGSYLFRLKKELDEKAKSDDKDLAAQATRHAGVVKEYTQKIINAEKDEDNLKQYKNLQKDAGI
ncbi:MAG: M1 family peptidase [Taibaiella sp.]|nr:M1 family peptidase [Taibaiella sp.]